MQRPVKLVIFAGIVLVLLYFINETFLSEENYTKPLLKEREDKDLSFRSRTNSPFAEEDRRDFKNLVYYEPNVAYRVTAKIEDLPKQDTLLMPLTNGSYEPYLRYAIANFELEGQPQRLTLYKKLAKEEKDQWFVPFTDKTNGFETYGGGRYLDIPYKEDAKTVVLDFNRAYSPFCAFNPEYVCPVPPKDNRLTVAIPAGERTYEIKK
ncbi:DUF1684 domain-containing protein [Pontibacter sp. BT310]|uniref:DUF1684 domain-containing protein n=1 Tax=Pontibacter populi TaxID=890055 RepID=A0ABS6XE46_9BACT|nr:MULTISPECIES: DUF1684 domain-containing protein [Pontibacter]MBJ6119415.1 DUF1684 domain-containing protein [Pontibacter sp. BT310]MBR0571843.1 DUF1684 domain-containing protein [Microvirga sp. STS03]MBW3366269.1 DUF1684 domain-containing protein [Pontibacter populi]